MVWANALEIASLDLPRSSEYSQTSIRLADASDLERSNYFMLAC